MLQINYLYSFSYFLDDKKSCLSGQGWGRRTTMAAPVTECRVSVQAPIETARVKGPTAYFIKVYDKGCLKSTALDHSSKQVSFTLLYNPP